MAIIRYEHSTTGAPNYITHGGYFHNADMSQLFCIGSGGGTELSKSELITFVLSLHSANPQYEQADGAPWTRVLLSDSDVTPRVNAWCTAMGVS